MDTILQKSASSRGDVRMSEEPVLDSQSAEHCVARITALVAQKASDRRSILQLGYNLGRLSELTGLGREAFWDRWKTPVEAWDLAEMERLAQELLYLFQHGFQRD